MGAAWLSLAPPVSTMPEPFEKIELDRMEFPLAVGPFTVTPAPVLKAITLPAPVAVPPIVLFDASVMFTPLPVLPKLAPLALVPM